MVRELALRSRPTLADYVKLLKRFRDELPGNQSYEEYYFHLFDYHSNSPQAVTALQVLTQFLETVPEALRLLLLGNLVHLRDLPDQQSILSIIRSFTPMAVAVSNRTPVSPATVLPPQADKPVSTPTGPTQQRGRPQPRGRHCDYCKGEDHTIAFCDKCCLNCKQPGHNSHRCPILCSHCKVAGGHVYKYCKGPNQPYQQHLLLDSSQQHDSALPQQFPCGSTIIVNSQSQHNQIQSFKQANENHGQVCHMTLSIGGHTAVVGVDTGCARCVLSQQFLDKFDIPPDWKRPYLAEIDNGSVANIRTSEMITLPLKFQTDSLRTDWIILPRLAAPLDALISWSWLVRMAVIIDCDANMIQFKAQLPAKILVAPDFRQLKLKSESSTTPLDSTPNTLW